MTTELKQPEALRLADWLQSCAESIEQINAANELRRLYALTQRPAAQTEREAFEAFAAKNEFGSYLIERKGDGYWSSHTQLMWMAWQARASLPAAHQATKEPK